MKFEFSNAELSVSAIRLDKPPRMDEISYTLVITTSDTGLNVALLKKNIEKFGTIYNTVAKSCKVNGTLSIVNSL